MDRKVNYEEFEKRFNNLGMNEILDFHTIDGDSENEWSRYKFGCIEVEFDEFCSEVKMMSYEHTEEDGSGVGTCISVDNLSAEGIWEDIMAYSKDKILYEYVSDIEILEFDGGYKYREIPSVEDDMLSTWVVGPESLTEQWEKLDKYPEIDEKYFCYVPDEMFLKYDNENLARWIAENFF